MKAHPASACKRMLLAILSAAFLALPTRAADTIQPSPDRERELIAVLQSSAPAAEKALACKHLAIHGSTAAVPVLAPLLADPELSSWARIPLEVIPGPAVDEALRQSLSRLEGRLLVGVIHSIGVRRDALAVDALIRMLNGPSLDVTGAAALALGQIGGDRAAAALGRSLANPSADVRATVAYGAILCAENHLARGETSRAIRLYDAVRASSLPQQRVLEAIRGAILARGPDGIPLLLEQLRSEDRHRVGIGLRTARELPGSEVTRTLAAELEGAAPERQAPLLLALADRQDDAVLPAVLEVARQGSIPLRLVAIGALDRLGDISCLPVLLKAATDGHAPLARAAKQAIGRLEGDAVDAALFARLPDSSGILRQVLVEMVGLRRIEPALPAVLVSARSTNPGVRRAAAETLAILGGEPEAAELVRLLTRTEDARDRAAIENALGAICGRVGQSCLPLLLPLAQHADAELRSAGIQLFAVVGGAEALAAVRAALGDPDESVQDEAVRTLAGWPGNWPDDVEVAEPLLTLARSAPKPAHRIQGIRGYLQFIQETRQMDDAAKLARVQDLMPLLQRPEEQRLAISVLGAIPTGEVLETLIPFTANATLAEEACQSIVRVAAHERLRRGAGDVRQAALQAVIDRSTNEATRKRATDLLRRR